MRGRRRFLTASLAALAVLLLAGIGVGAWVASSDDDDPSSLIAGAPSEGSPGQADAESPGAVPPGSDGSASGDATSGDAQTGDAPSGDAPSGGVSPGDASGDGSGDDASGGSSSGDASGGGSSGDALGGGSSGEGFDGDGSGDSADDTPSGPGGAPTKTRFPRERGEDPDRRGKRFSVPPAHEFTGTGNALIGTVDVRKPALVRWTSKGRFGLEFGREAFPIIAPSKSGQLVVPPYRFELVRVLAKGAWTITVTPQD